MQLTFLLRDQANPSSPYVFNDSVPAGDTKRYDNAVQNLFGLSGVFGAMHIVADRSVVVNSRIYSTRPAFLGGSGETPAGRVPLAIVGIVPVKATAENGAITPGDLLVASSTPGHVMRCDDRARCIGGIVGKALSRLADGTGSITALVSLH